MKRLRTPRRKAGGFMLLEALIGILIFSVGVLGLVGLQAAMTKAQTSTKFRADAAYLASELVGTMWGDVAKLSEYQTANCQSNTRCQAWSSKVASMLPNGASTVTVASGVVTITITWTPPNEETHRFETATAVVS